MQPVHDPNLRPIQVIIGLVDEVRRNYLSPASNRRNKCKESSISHNLVDFRKPFDNRGNMLKILKAYGKPVSLPTSIRVL